VKGRSVTSRPPLSRRSESKNEELRMFALSRLAPCSDLAPKFYPVLSSLQRFLRCSPNLGQRALEFSGVMAQLGGGADEPFISEIGTLLPMALCGRNSL
jgi:hypothetical protein